MMLTDLINLGSGFEAQLLEKLFYKSAELIRRMPDEKYDKVINVNLDSVVFGNFDLRLQNLDKFVVHANTNFLKENIKLLGEIRVLSPYIRWQSLLNVINADGWVH